MTDALARLRSAQASFEVALGLGLPLDEPEGYSSPATVKIDLALEADADLVAACAGLSVPPPGDELPLSLASYIPSLGYWRVNRWLRRRLAFVNALLASLESKTPGDEGPYR